MTYARTPILLALGLLLVGDARAGSLTAPAAPDNPGSGMYRIGASMIGSTPGPPGPCGPRPSPSPPPAPAARVTPSTT
jgi:hypothetical protein